MTKAAAMQKFMDDFCKPHGMKAYAASAVPDKATLPYLTYELVTGAWGDGDTNMVVKMWFHTDSEAVPNAVVQSFSERIGLGGVVLSCEEGAVWIKRGKPWCQSMHDNMDPRTKLRYINVAVEYLTSI